MPRTMIDIPKTTKYNAKVVSAEQGITFKEFVTKAIDEAVMKHLKKTRSIDNLIDNLKDR